jgi:GR25 family glycosyltransferase involved in LPS biosynthesis
MDKVDIYVINLDRDTERLKKFKNNMKQYNYTRIKAIYGKEEDMTKYDEILYTSKFIVPKNVLGASLSHRKALKTFIETSDKEYAIIFEDDAIPSNIDTLDHDINEIFETAPKGWDMIKLDFWPQLHKDSYAKYPTFGFTSYIITKKGASNFIDNKIVYYPDSDANFYHNLNLYNHKKIVFYQDWENTDSSVHTSANNYNPLSHINDGINIKTIRIGDYDIILSDLLLILILFILFIILQKYSSFFNKYISKMIKYISTIKLN